MVFTLRILVFSLFLSAVLPVGFSLAQDIQFSFTPETANFAPDRFRMDIFRDDGETRSARFTANEVIFGDGSSMIAGAHQYSVSANRAYVGALFIRGGQVSVEIYRSDGDLVNRIAPLADHDSNDPSIRLYMQNDGSFIYQDNIAGFTFYDERGAEVFRASNSSGSVDGETISTYSTPDYARVSYVINPEIYDGDLVRSRVQKMDMPGEPEPVISLPGMAIREVVPHPAGRMLVILAQDAETGTDRGYVTSFQGQLLAELDYEENEIRELVLSDDGRFVTARASGRVLVHRVIDGERLGSASFSETVLVAAYMPDGILSVLTGRRSADGQLENLRGHMIDIEQRRVVRETTTRTVYTSELFPLRFMYVSSGTYRLEGTNRGLEIRHGL
ncbi:hypothetical protein QA596_11315 [Balneolales bacterium ANBcel1]|nr:hypothetical protein [Balneolales bacterium ANBcel1]